MNIGVRHLEWDLFPLSQAATEFSKPSANELWNPCSKIINNFNMATEKH
jgi:hypothetical protein